MRSRSFATDETLSTTAGRVFRCSEPTLGSNWIHHTAPWTGAGLVLDGLVTVVLLTKSFKSGEGTVGVVVALTKRCGLFHEAVTLVLR